MDVLFGVRQLAVGGRKIDSQLARGLLLSSLHFDCVRTIELSSLRSARRNYLRFQMFRKEINDRVVTGDAVFVFENVMTFIFKDQQFHILTFGF